MAAAMLLTAAVASAATAPFGLRVHGSPSPALVSAVETRKDSEKKRESKRKRKRKTREREDAALGLRGMQ